MGLFVRITLIVALALVALFVALLVLKIVVIAALVAGAVVIGGYVWNRVTRRSTISAPPATVRRP